MLEKETAVKGVTNDEIFFAIGFGIYLNCASLFRKELLSYLDLLRIWYRDVLVFAETGLNERLWNADSAEAVAQLAEHHDHAGIQVKLEAVARAQMLLEHNVKEERVFKELFFSLGE